jgi:hypothetical protein
MFNFRKNRKTTATAKAPTARKIEMLYPFVDNMGERYAVKIVNGNTVREYLNGKTLTQQKPTATKSTATKSTATKCARYFCDGTIDSLKVRDFCNL